MNTKYNSVYKAVKKLKLPKKNKKPNVLFKAFINKEAFIAAEKPKLVIQKQQLHPPQPKKEKKEKPSKKRRRELLELMQTRFPADLLKDFKKKDKRAHKHLFNDGLQYQVFCQWVNTCRRVNRPPRKHRRLQRLRNKPLNKKERRSKYEIFIASPQWESRKNAYYQTNKRQCAACASFKYIHLHHMVYGEFGKEPDEHLVPLCKDHHKGYHDKYGTQRHMITTTLQYIKDIQASLTSPHQETTQL